MRLVIDLQGAQGENARRGIGRYSRELAFAMAQRPRGHEVSLLLNGAALETAEALAARFSTLLPRADIRTWFPPTPQPDPGFTRQAAALVRAQVLDQMRPSLVHVSSVFEGLDGTGVTAWPPSLQRIPQAGTLYDLIPLVRHGDYLAPGGSLAAHADWYYACLHQAALLDGYLAISESSRQEALRHLRADPDRAFNIGAGIGEAFRPPPADAAARAAFRRRHGLEEQYILFAGAGDKRKNEAVLIDAYARLPHALLQAHQLVILGAIDRARLCRLLDVAGLQGGRVHILPFIPEDDLQALYAGCALFVYPSLHEGFGLPAAEAMACGAPVIASNTSSLPEVIGLDEALFDPTDAPALAALMERVLTQPELRDRLVQHGGRRAAELTWASCADKAWDALEAVQDRCPAQPGLRQLPTLAFVSPLPPAASGIADYSQALAPALARHYDITLVCQPGETTDPWLRAAFPCLDPAGFQAASARFDRVLYQLGCSEFHSFQFNELLPFHPGVSVLHDTFLSNLWNHIAHQQGNPGAFLTELYLSHGYPALQVEQDAGRAEAVRRFPCCLPVLEASLGVIQHSAYAADLLAQHFGPAVRESPHIIPQLAYGGPVPDRAEARRMLAVDPDVLLVCSFGIVSPAKLPQLLLDAWRAMQGEKGRLVFVGSQYVAVAGLDGEAAMATGRVDADTYRAWLGAADIAVQLRTDSRGETSGAVTDCLAAGVPVILNAHGPAAELPEGSVRLVADPPDVVAVRDAIEQLRDGPAARQALAQSGRAFVQARLRPAGIAAAFHTAIEAAYRFGAERTSMALFGRLNMADAADQALVAAAGSIAASLTPPGAPRLLVDVSELARQDVGSGIQRVVREIGARLLAHSSPRRTEAVRYDGGELRHAYALGTRLLGCPALDLEEAPVDYGPGDIFLCLDLNPAMTEAEFADLRRRKLAGTRIVLVVYDLLPMLRPAYFPDGIKVVSAWYKRMLGLADQAICISRAVADELACWMARAGPPRPAPLHIGFFHLGADFTAGAANGAGTEPDYAAAIASMTRRPVFLMVGTLEPRKGYTQALAAFERLWADGRDVGLVVVGKQGWQMERLTQRITRHAELGSRLHWLPATSDAGLRRLYSTATCLLMASEGEGFGLPLIEAARAGLPILARDLPVFHEVAGPHAAYFSGQSAEGLAGAVRHWLGLHAAGEAPRSTEIRTRDWDGSVRDLLGQIGAGAVSWPTPPD